MRIGRHLGQWARASPSPNDARERLGRIGEVWPAAAGGVRKGRAVAGVDGACAQTLASTPKPATCPIPPPTGPQRTALLTPLVGENGAAAMISLREELRRSLLPAWWTLFRGIQAQQQAASICHWAAAAETSVARV